MASLKDIANAAKNFFVAQTPIAMGYQGTKQIVQSPTFQKVMNTPIPQGSFLDRVNTVVQGANKVASRPMDVATKGYVDFSTGGLVKTPFQAPNTAPEKLLYGVGAGVGVFSPVSAINKVMGATGAVGSKLATPIIPKVAGNITSPLLVKYAPKVIPAIGAELAQTAAYTGGQAIAGQQITPGSNLAMGLGMRGLIGAGGQAAKSLTGYSPRIYNVHPDDAKVMSEFIYQVQTGKAKQNLGQLGVDASRLAKYYLGDKWQTVTNEKLAKAFDAVLSNNAYRKGMDGLPMEYPKAPLMGFAQSKPTTKGGGIEPLIEEARKYKSAEEFARGIQVEGTPFNSKFIQEIEDLVTKEQNRLVKETGKHPVQIYREMKANPTQYPELWRLTGELNARYRSLEGLKNQVMLEYQKTGSAKGYENFYNQATSPPPTTKGGGYTLTKNLRLRDAYGKNFLGYNMDNLEKVANEKGYSLFDALIKRVDSQGTTDGKIKGMESILDDLYGAKPTLSPPTTKGGGNTISLKDLIPEYYLPDQEPPRGTLYKVLRDEKAIKEYQTVVDNYKKDILSGKEIEPIIVSDKGIIIDGQHRYEAYKQLGKDTIPFVKGNPFDVYKTQLPTPPPTTKGINSPAPRVASTAQNQVQSLLPSPQTTQSLQSQQPILRVKPSQKVTISQSGSNLVLPSTNSVTHKSNKVTIVSLNKKLEELTGEPPTTGNWKQDFAMREMFIKEIKKEAPPEIVKQIEDIEDQIFQLQNARKAGKTISVEEKAIADAKQLNAVETVKREIQRLSEPTRRKISSYLDSLDSQHYKVTKDWENNTTVSVSPDVKTTQKIKIRDLKAEEKAAKQAYKEWQTQMFSQEGAMNTTQALKTATGNIKTNTLSPVSRNVEELTDISGFQGQTRDIYRNFKQVFGKRYEQAKKLILDPFDKSKGQFVDDLDKWAADLDKTIVRGLGIKKGSKESALIQMYGEGQITKEQLMMATPKWQQVMAADEWFRGQYDTLLNQVNEIRRRIYPTDPSKIIPRRNDYYRHFREMQEGFAGLKNIFESPANISSSLAGISPNTKPKSKFLSFAQQRLGMATDIDAVGGFLDYIKAASYAKNIDPHIANFRNLADELAQVTGPESLQAGKLNNFIEFLQDFANDLSGKTNAADRFIQKVIPGGRKAMNVITWLNNRVKANTVIGNLSSSLAQIFNVPQGIASAGKYSLNGLKRTLGTIFTPDPAMSKSIFIKERYFKSLDKFDTGILSDTKKFATWITQVSDEVGTKYIWESHYAKALAEGIQDPIKYADDLTRSLVAGRGIGEVPLLQKSKVFQLIAPFQLEVGNLWWVMKDWVDERQFGKLATFFVTSYVFNRAAEQIRGSDVSFDPINAVSEAIQAFKEEEDTKRGLMRAGGRVGGEILSNVPLGQTVAAAYPEYGFKIGDTQLPTRKDFFGKGDPTRFGSGLLAIKGAQDPLFKILPPFAGGQIKKTIQGVDAYRQGYLENKSGNIMTPVEQNTANALRMAAFGQYAAPEARQYFDTNARPLSEKQTIKVKSGNIKEEYKKIMDERTLNNELDKAREMVKQTNQAQRVGEYMVYPTPKLNKDTGEYETNTRTVKIKPGDSVEKEVSKIKSVKKAKSGSAKKVSLKISKPKAIKLKMAKTKPIKIAKAPTIKIKTIKAKALKMPSAKVKKIKIAGTKTLAIKIKGA